MKILFWILVIFSMLLSAATSFIFFLIFSFGMEYSLYGRIVSMLGMLSGVVWLACAVTGIVKLCKGSPKKALKCVSFAVVYCVIIFAATLVDNAVNTLGMNKDIADQLTLTVTAFSPYM